MYLGKLGFFFCFFVFFFRRRISFKGGGCSTSFIYKSRRVGGWGGAPGVAPLLGSHRRGSGGAGGGCHVRALRSVSAKHSRTSARAWMIPEVGGGTHEVRHRGPG